MTDDLISRQAAISEIMEDIKDRSLHDDPATPEDYAEGYDEGIRNAAAIVLQMPSAQPTGTNTVQVDDCISREAVGDALNGIEISRNASWYEFYQKALTAVGTLPSAQPPKEIPKRVLWSGWKGYRDTRYKCPNCEKPVRNDDAYCHRCGQRLMFPKISFTDYVPGQKQDVIVRWDDEG